MVSHILRNNFIQVLHERNKGLLYKWAYNSKLTNCEKDELAVCSRIAREISGTDK